MTRAPTGFLGVVLVTAGASSLAIEICASRLLAPYFGTSTVVWANVIGLILVYLSVGYFVGGRVADRWPTTTALGWILLGAALSTAALPFAARPLLSLTLAGLSASGLGAVAGSFFTTLVLFSVPVSLLGMASPFALRLSIGDLRRAGATSGRLSSLGTLGAIAGTFASALVLIPAIGTQRTLLAAALLAALLALRLVGAPALAAVTLIAALMAVPPGSIKPSAGTVAEMESRYQYLQVLREPGGRVVLRTDEGVADQSVYLPGASLTGGEWDMPLVVPPLLDRPLRRVLVLGNAGGAVARALAAAYPGVLIDGVELDPAVTDLARRYMALDRIPGLTVTTADARAFVETTARRYDLITVDAYRRTYIPFHLVTREFFDLLRAHLVPGGAIALNVARVPGDERLAVAVAGTVAASFPQTWVWPALRFNELVVGLDVPLPPDGLAARELRLPSLAQPLAGLVVGESRQVPPAGHPLIDDRAPVEWLADRAVLAYIARGGRLEERLLPTAP